MCVPAQETDLLAAYFSNIPSLLPPYVLNQISNFNKTCRKVIAFVNFYENCCPGKLNPQITAPKEGKAGSVFSLSPQNDSTKHPKRKHL